MSESTCAAIGLVAYSLTANDELLTNVVTGAAVRAPRGTGARLASCRPFRTLDEHARQFGAAAHAGRGDVASREDMAGGSTSTSTDTGATRAFERLRAQGLFIDFETFIAWLRGPAANTSSTSSTSSTSNTATPNVGAASTFAAAAPRIATLTVPTCGRPALLARSLAGFLRHARDYDRRLRVIVADQSPDADDRARGRAELRSIAADCGHAPYYVGPDEIARYGEALCRHLQIAPEIVAFALADPLAAGFAAGANRNALLLASIGEPSLSVDDDMICRLSAHPARDGAEIAVAGAATPDWWSFATRDAVLEMIPALEEDAFACAESVLGRPVADCVLRSRGPADVHVDALDARTLHESRGAVVRAAMFGVSGDAGTPAGRRAALLLEGEERARLAASDETYRRAALSREVHRASRRTTIYGAPQCMAGALALDGRIGLPPFLPVRAGEDGVFALLLRMSHPAAFFAALPYSLLHAPGESRAVDDDALERLAATMTLADVIEACVAAARTRTFHADPSVRLRKIGEELSALAILPGPEFWEVVRMERWRLTSADLARLDALLTRFGRCPAAWAADVERYQAAARGAAAGERFFTPRDLLDGRAPAEARAFAQEIVRRFAQLLTVWPGLRQGVLDLRRKGVCLEAPA